VSGLAAGVATFLATPSSANLASAVTDETGSGSLVFATSPTLTTPNIGTPSAGTLTSCTGLPLTTGVTGTLPIANGGTGATTAATAFTALKQAASDTASGVMEIATAAEMETGTDVLRAVTPGRVRYHGGVAKAWAYCESADGTPALTASYNMTSVTDVGVGTTRFNFATDMSAATAYSEFGTIDSADPGNELFYHFTSSVARSTGASRNFITEGTGPAVADTDHCVVFFGDQV
jgi:hypothetical protein